MNSLVDRIAVYGTLQRGASAWRLMEPLVSGLGEDVWLPGQLYDTACGYPALKLDDECQVPAQVFRLRAPERALPLLDDYEGPEYERRVIEVAGAPCWVYVWRGAVDGMRPLRSGWLAERPNNG